MRSDIWNTKRRVHDVNKWVIRRKENAELDSSGTRRYSITTRLFYNFYEIRIGIYSVNYRFVRSKKHLNLFKWNAMID